MSEFDDTAISTDLPNLLPEGLDERPSGRHPINIAHLVMGVAFAGLFLIWALIETHTVEPVDYRWLMPVPWLAAGAVGLAASVWPSRKRAGR